MLVCLQADPTLVTLLFFAGWLQQEKHDYSNVIPRYDAETASHHPPGWSHMPIKAQKLTVSGQHNPQPPRERALPIRNKD